VGVAVLADVIDGTIAVSDMIVLVPRESSADSVSCIPSEHGTIPVCVTFAVTDIRRSDAPANDTPISVSNDR
jgi:hypothetical protein